MFSARCPALIKKTYKTVTRTCTKCVDAIKIKGHFLLKFDFFTTQKWVGNEIAFHLPPELQQSNYRHPWERTMGKANCACTKLHPELQHRLQVTKERSLSPPQCLVKPADPHFGLFEQKLKNWKRKWLSRDLHTFHRNLTHAAPVQGRPRPGTHVLCHSRVLVGHGPQKTARNYRDEGLFWQDLHLLASIRETRGILFQPKQQRLESTEVNNLNKFCSFSDGLRPKCHPASVLHLGKHEAPEPTESISWS